MNSILRQQRRSSIAAAVVTILLGLFLAFWPGQSVSFLCMLLGAAIAVTGIIYFVGWLALGVLVVVNPFGTFAALMGLVGASLIFDGVTDLVIIWRLSRAFRDI